MRLSIITINYNNCEGLKKTIDSVVAQTFNDFEWIVIDGGSTDGSRELLEQYADHFAYWVSEPDKGIYNAMNKGIKVARGEYLQFLNSGDWLCDETALERFFSHVFDADVVYGDYYFSGMGDGLVECRQPQVFTFRVLLDSALGHNACFFKSLLFKEEAYDEDLKVVSDWKFCLVQAMTNKRFSHVDEFVSCFDVTGISSVNKELTQSERNKVLKELVPELILLDYKAMEDMENELSDVLVKSLFEYSQKRVLYSRALRRLLSVFRILERRVFGKSSGN